ncbi:MAG TPA: hypothetical protein VGX95_06500, partial [Xanthobacteraceae bacterium]|nr:hypothetical protein [Xanthobacteraceae bacterium]
GVDLVLVSFDTDQFYTAMHGLLAAERDGRLQPEALAQSDERLRRAAPASAPALPNEPGLPPSR